MKRLRILLCMFLMALFVGCFAKPVAAETIAKQGKKTVEGAWSSKYNDKNDVYIFRYDGSSAYMMTAETELLEYGPKNSRVDRVIIGTYEYDSGKVIYSYKFNINTGAWIRVGGEDTLQKGKKYSFYIQYYGGNENTVRVTYKINRYPQYASSVKFPSKVTMKTGDYKQLKITTVPTGALVDADWKSTNRSVAEVDTRGYITAKKSRNGNHHCRN